MRAQLRAIALTGLAGLVFLLWVEGHDSKAARQERRGGAGDDTDLQKMVDAGTGTIRLTHKTYRITRPIIVDLDKVGFTAFVADGTARLVMAGPGPAIRFVGTHGGTAAPSSFKANVWERQRTPMVEGLEIVGEHAEADGVAAEGTMQLTLSRLTIRECRHGVHLLRRNRNVLISACHIYNNKGVGVYYDHVNLHQSNIVGCHISYCGGGGVVSRGGEVRNVQISGCDIEANMAKDGPATANVLLDSKDGSIAEVAITGCTIQHASNGPDSANIRILGRGESIKKGGTAQWGHVTIGNNVLSDVQVNIDIQDSRGVVLTGNTFWMGYAHNLKVENSQQVVASANAFERNPGYDYGTSLQTTNAILFRNCQDCTLSGLHVHHVYKADAAVTLDGCRRMNMTSCSILDCEGTALLWKGVTNSRLSGCLIRNDLAGKKPVLSLRVAGGKGNVIAGNTFANGAEIPREAGVSEGNQTGQ